MRRNHLLFLCCVLFLLFSPNIILAEKNAPPTPPLDPQKRKALPSYPKIKINPYPKDSEKNALLDSFFGNFTKAKKIKNGNKIELKKYDEYIEYSNSIKNKMMKDIMLQGINNLTVYYDEIWIDIDDHLFTPQEKKKYKGTFNINKLYWKKDKIQAATHERLFSEDPISRQKLLKPEYKIIYIYDRDSILNKLKK